MPRNNSCEFCGKVLRDIIGLKNHQNLSRNCRQQLDESLRSLSYAPHARQPPTNRSKQLRELHEALAEEAFHFEWDPASILRHHDPPSGDEEDVVNPNASAEGDSESSRHIEQCAASLDAGVPVDHRKTQTDFEMMRDERLEREEDDDPIWSPFVDREEWDLATWLIRTVGQNSTDEFLKLPIVSRVFSLKII